MRTFIFGAGTFVLLLVACVSPAQAAPVFLTPDLAFAERGDPVAFNGESFALAVSTDTGGATALDSGSGFVPTNTAMIDLGILGSPTETGFRYLLNGTIVVGQGVSISAGGPLTLVRSTVGYDGLDIMRVMTATPDAPWTVGQTIGLDLHLFNVVQNGAFWNADVKGDLAPVVPEPATLGLVLLGIGGVVSARRRFK